MRLKRFGDINDLDWNRSISNSAYLVFSMGFLPNFDLYSRKLQISKMKYFLYFLIAIFFFVLGFGIGTPYAFLDWQYFIASFGELDRIKTTEGISQEIDFLLMEQKSKTTIGLSIFMILWETIRGCCSVVVILIIINFSFIKRLFKLNKKGT